MHPAEEFPERSASAAEARAEKLEREHGPRLRETLVTTYGIAAEDAAGLVEDVFRSFLTTDGIVDAAAWLAAALRGEARRYLQRSPAKVQARAAAAPAQDAIPKERLREVLPTLPEPARTAVWLRWFEGWSYEAIALELDVSTHYVKELVFRSLATLRGRTRRRRT